VPRGGRDRVQLLDGKNVQNSERFFSQISTLIANISGTDLGLYITKIWKALDQLQLQLSQHNNLGYLNRLHTENSRISNLQNFNFVALRSLFLSGCKGLSANRVTFRLEGWDCGVADCHWLSPMHEQPIRRKPRPIVIDDHGSTPFVACVLSTL